LLKNYCFKTEALLTIQFKGYQAKRE